MVKHRAGLAANLAAPSPGLSEMSCDSALSRIGTVLAVDRAVPWLAFLAALTIIVPQIPEAPALRAFIALAGLWALVKEIELWRRGGRPTLMFRLRSWTAPYDLHEVVPATPRVDAGRWALALAAGAGSLASFQAAVGADAAALRWAAGAAGFYLAVEAGTKAMAAGYLLAGWALPPILKRPLLSASVAEFWGRRWNRPVHAQLRARIFMPLARRGRPQLALMLAFAASAIGHAYPIAVSLGFGMAAAMAAFFVVQPVLLHVERSLGVSSWPRPIARAWTLLVVLGLSPLFIEPLLRLIESAGGRG
jgi:hypothetical protein